GLDLVERGLGGLVGDSVEPLGFRTGRGRLRTPGVVGHVRSLQLWVGAAVAASVTGSRDPVSGLVNSIGVVHGAQRYARPGPHSTGHAVNLNLKSNLRPHPDLRTAARVTDGTSNFAGQDAHDGEVPGSSGPPSSPRKSSGLT